MAKQSWSRTHLFVFLWLGLALCVAVFSIFANGYASANTTNVEAQEIVFELQSEAMTQNFVSKIVNPLFTTTASYDFTSDDSYQRYLSNETPFSDLNYVPVDLAPINSNFTANNSKKFELRQTAGDEFADMARHFRDDFKWDKLYVLSAYRSKSYQDGLLKRWCKANACAKGWASEHQAWLALDLRVVTKWGKMISLDYPNKYTDWLHAHAQEWGFHNTYQKGVAIDGKIVEGWHRRYMGVELATLLREKGDTIAEYYKWIQN